MATMRAAKFEPGCGPEKLTIGESPVPELGSKEVLIKVVTTAINRADTLQRLGKYPVPPGQSQILGLEAAGHIEKVHEGCTKWKLGDRVMALTPGGGNAEYVAVHEDHVMPIPTEMNFVNAAAIPEVWLTAYQLLHFVGHVKAGDFVLIHAGGSGVGTAAVQLALLAGARPIVTAGTQAKIDKAIALGAGQGFNYKEGPWSDKVLNSTSGHGADVILDCVGGSYWEQNLACIALEGRWVLYGLLGGGNVNGNILGQLLQKRASLASSTLRARSIEYKRDLVSAFAKDALPFFADGTIKPLVDRVYPLDKLSTAHADMEANANSGKIVLVVAKDKSDKTEL